MPSPEPREELARAQSLVQAFKEACPCGVLFLDEEGAPVAYNRLFLEIWGLDLATVARGREAMISRAKDLHVDPDAFVSRIAQLWITQADRAQDHFELIDGRVIDQYRSVVRGAAGEVVGTLLFFRDTTAEVRYRRRMQAQVRMSKLLAESDRFEATAPVLLEAIGDSLGCAVGNLWIARGARLELQASWHMPGRNYPRFLGRSRKLSIKEGEGFLGRVLESGAPVWAADIEAVSGFRRLEAARYEGLLSGFAFPVRRGGAVFGILEFFMRWHQVADAETMELVTGLCSQIAQAIDRQHAREESDRRSAEAKKLLDERIATLQEVDRIKRAFLDTASHEFRTPLTRIMAFAEFLEDGLGGPLTAEQMAFVREIQQGAKAVARLADDMLDLALIEAGTFSLAVRDADLGLVVRGVLDGLAGLAHERGVRLRATVPPGPLDIIMDSQRVAQAVYALVSNAIKFTNRGGMVRVAVRKIRRSLCVTVRDTGIGIPVDEQRRIFDKFYQVDYGTTRAFGGSGLGLAIARGVVEAHGGKIGVKSSPGKGSLFWFYLPLVPTSSLTFAPDAPADAPTRH